MNPSGAMGASSRPRSDASTHASKRNSTRSSAPSRSRRMADIDLGKAFARLEAATPRRESGRVTEVTGLVIRASVPGVRVGEVVNIASPDTASTRRGDSPPPPLRAEVVGLRGDEIVLMPLSDAAGIGPDSLVTPTSRPFSIGVSDHLLGRVLDGLGQPIDGAGPIADTRDWT